MGENRCAECDKMVLVYALAVNHQNEIASQLQAASSTADRQALSEALTRASRDCQALRARLAEHYLLENTPKLVAYPPGVAYVRG